MKPIAIALLFLLRLPALGQEYPFARDFVNGAVILKDSTRMTGQIKWFPSQDEKVRFRETPSSDTKKYTPEDLVGFTVDTFRFVSLPGFEACMEYYPLTGKKSRIKHAFGESLAAGRINAYIVPLTGYNGFSRSIETYPNLLFQRTRGDSILYAAFPFGMRMKESKFEKAKTDLYSFFEGYPAIISKIRDLRRQDDLFELIGLIKKENDQ
jgi:hypothetical protein